MVHNLVGFNLNGVRLDLSVNGVDHIRRDCRNFEFLGIHIFYLPVNMDKIQDL